MPAWSLKAGGVAAAEWFNLRFQRARGLMPAAKFDSIIGEDFANTITSEIVDVVGVASASPVSFYNTGVVALSIGDSDIGPSSARLQLTVPPSHVGDLRGKSWYVASLVRCIRPVDGALGDTAIDMIGLWGDDDNRIGLGIFNGSGGSITNWVGYAMLGASATTVLGPALDPEEGTVWHLFEAWFDFDAQELSFAVDGITFDDTIAGAAVPNVPATLSVQGSQLVATGAFATNYDKWCAVVRAPVVGETT
jgi:hypothetical protein